MHKLEDKFQGIELHHVPRKDNDAADFLAKLAARWDPSPFLALINGLRIAVERGAMRLYIHDDSELVINQVMKESSCKSPLMVAYS